MQLHLDQRVGAFFQPTLLIVVLALLLSAACQPLEVPAASDEEGGSAPVAAEAPVPEESSDMIELSGVQQLLATRIQEELAAELGISMDEIVVTEAEEVEWPDASLGCPQEGMMYAQVITPGYRFVLEADGNSYEYHTSEREDSMLVRCESN